VLITDLIKLIPDDTRERVEQALQRFAAAVREVIRLETRLVLQWRDRDGGTEYTCQCPVSVSEIAYPEELSDREIPPAYALASIVSLWKPSLRQLSQGAGGVIELLETHESELSEHLVVPQALNAVRSANDTSRQLLRLAQIKDNSQYDLVTHILAVNTDVLGVYRYPAGPENPHVSHGLPYRRNYRAEILLYWGIIGLCARALGVSTEALSIVVLAHELGQAYTHLGFDRDGKRWAGEDFRQSEHDLKEALAQYYTVRVVERLAHRFPEAKRAYQELLPRQPRAYRRHDKWLQDETAEAVGNALSICRRRGAVRYDEFCHEVQGLTTYLQD